MQPAAAKAPADFVFALMVCAVVVIVSFFVSPALCRWIVFGVGVIMAISVLAVALRPSR